MLHGVYLPSPTVMPIARLRTMPQPLRLYAKNALPAQTGNVPWWCGSESLSRCFDARVNLIHTVSLAPKIRSHNSKLVPEPLHQAPLLDTAAADTQSRRRQNS